MAGSMAAFIIAASNKHRSNARSSQYYDLEPGGSDGAGGGKKRRHGRLAVVVDDAAEVEVEAAVVDEEAADEAEVDAMVAEMDLFMTEAAAAEVEAQEVAEVEAEMEVFVAEVAAEEVAGKKKRKLKRQTEDLGEDPKKELKKGVELAEAAAELIIAAGAPSGTRCEASPREEANVRDGEIGEAGLLARIEIREGATRKRPRKETGGAATRNSTEAAIQSILNGTKAKRKRVTISDSAPDSAAKSSSG
jgi:hypothetical protein